MLVFFSSKEEIDMDKAISYLPEKEECELFNNVRDTEVGEPYLFGKGIYMYMFYCLCDVKDIYKDMS